MVPRESGFQYGAPRPVKAGTIITPPESGTLCASDSTSLLVEMARSPSRSHCTTAPPTKTLPSMANSGCTVACAALVVSRPFCDVWNVPPVCMSMKQPVP
ncbi:hypothetical protein D3C71_1589260 [compost metagenome]